MSVIVLDLLSGVGGRREKEREGGRGEREREREREREVFCSSSKSLED
jgi:hypothetical protein